MAGHDSLIGPRRVVKHGVGLARAGHDDRDDRRAQKRGDRQGIGMCRHVGRLCEAAVVELLGAAGRVEPDHLDEHRVEEVGDRRIVERQVAVLADAGADDVGRLGLEQVFVVEAGLQRALDLLAGDQPEAVGA